MGAGKNILWFSIGFVSATAVAAGGVAIAVCAVPSSAYLKDNVAGEAASASLLQLIMNAGNYTVDEFPIIEKVLNEAINNYQLDQYVSVDYEQLRGIKFGEFDFNSLFGTAIKITASINSLDLSSELGAFANLHIMTNWDAVPASEVPSGNAENPYLYYYLDNSKYVRAYQDDGTPVSSYSSQPLYYPALASIPLLDIGQVFEVRLGQQEAAEALRCFGMPSDSPLFKIVKDSTFNDLENLDINNLYLNDLLPYSEQSSLYDTILPILNDGKPADQQLTYDKVRLSDLEAINMDNIHLSTVVSGLDAGTQELLAEGCGVVSFDDITVKTISSFSLDRVHLSRAMKNPDPKLKAILMDITGATDWNAITLASLQGSMDINAIKLSNVLDSSSELFGILEDGLGKTGDQVSLGDLSTFDAKQIHLTKVIPEAGNERLYNVLKDMCNGKEPDQIRITDLNSIDTDKIRLQTVMNYDGTKTGNPVLDTLLGKNPTVGEIKDTFAAMTVHETFCENVFTTDKTNTINVDDTYDYNADGSYTYNHSKNGKYYISKTAGIWLVLGYDVTTNPTTGVGDSYKPSTLTVSKLTDATGETAIKNSMMGTPIYQLIASGMIDGAGMNDKLKPLTVQEVIKLANDYAALLPL